jgi:hypothetical protein
MLEQPKWFEINISTIRQTCERFIPRTVTSFTFWSFFGGARNTSDGTWSTKNNPVFFDDL